MRSLAAKIGNNVQIYPSCEIQFPWNLRLGDNVCLSWGTRVYNLGEISIGSNVVVSQYAHLCAGTHRYLEPGFPLVKSRIEIGDNVWICADSFIGPDVNICSNTVVGAKSVVMKSISEPGVYAGNPAMKRKD